MDSSGYHFIADYFVHKVTPEGLFSRGFATPELGPGGIAIDAAGNLFVDDQEWSVVWKVPPQGNGICCLAVLCRIDRKRNFEKTVAAFPEIFRLTT